MKNGILIMLVAGMALLAGCTQVGQPADAGTSADSGAALETGETAAADDAAIALPTVTPAAEAVAQSAEPLVTVPCSGELTSPNQEGPYFSAGSPERASLIDEGMPGVPLLLFGRVFDQACNPIAGAKLDFWLADVNGEYDNVGYTLRGHVFSDAGGNYAIESIEPTEYTGRPPHIHVKVYAPDGREVLTTQLYFVGSETSADVRSAPDLLAPYLDPDESGRRQVLFNFVVDTQ